MRYNFCPKCSSRLTVRRIDKKDHQGCSNCGFILYENSKPCVGVLIIEEDKVLLVQRAIEPFKGYWDIPGGFLEAGEHPVAGAVREVREETGLLIKPVEILDIFMDVYGPEGEPTLNICYLAKIIGGEPQVGSDVGKMYWFPIDAIPSDIAFEWEKEALELLLEKKRKIGTSMISNVKGKTEISL